LSPGSQKIGQLGREHTDSLLRRCAPDGKRVIVKADDLLTALLSLSPSATRVNDILAITEAGENFDDLVATFNGAPYSAPYRRGP